MEPNVKPAAQAQPCKVAALYRFCRLDGFEALREPLLALCTGEGIKGTLLLAREGINGTVAGPEAGIDRLMAWLDAHIGLAGMELKFSTASAMPPGYSSRYRRV